ncbi:hypothetical protein [Streptomyces sp. S.PB5]|uniref:hypothetical protein n=1 Tax=Streptomyces sp. S.PB5 TaxID=3020844 RepID=UPI0025B134B6|nr:hypothetical protein [Streptomyces sp. S.PB5]MDN3024808.1 hypothetical protein [Streptomyces sp. S.PB5]
MAETAESLLPIGGAALASDPRVRTAVHAIGARTGVDYTNDEAVRALLADRRRAANRAQHRPMAWLGGLALAAAATWPVVAMGVPSLGPKAALTAGPVIVLAVAALVQVRKGWKRELQHPALAGYREVLGVARAYGLPLSHVPAWLEGKTEGGTGKGATPIPSYSGAGTAGAQGPAGYAAEAGTADGQSSAGYTPAAGTADGHNPAGHDLAGYAPAARPQPCPHPGHATVPPKPPAVAEYERIADSGGWHDEGGCLLILAGGIGAAWAWSETEPIGYGALAAIPLAVIVWLAGSRQGKEKARLREEAMAYVRTVAAAQAAGAQVPELSPQLRKLLQD